MKNTQITTENKPSICEIEEAPIYYRLWLVSLAAAAVQTIMMFL